jgi:ABC-type transporter Mla subunit MlaD
LGSNQITDIAPLAGMTNLTWLGLWQPTFTFGGFGGGEYGYSMGFDDNNLITDWSPVSHVETVLGRPTDWDN